MMNTRTATPADVEFMHRIRLAVRENPLSDPTRISENDYLPFLATGGAWVAESEGEIVGFAIVDSTTNSVWALFVDPDAQGQGVGRALHEHILQWSSDEGMRRLSLSTSPGTYAEQFYRRFGWSEVGYTDDGEIRFEYRL